MNSSDENEDVDVCNFESTCNDNNNNQSIQLQQKLLIKANNNFCNLPIKKKLRNYKRKKGAQSKKSSAWTRTQNISLIKLISKYGENWNLIAQKFNEYAKREIKNHWDSLRKSKLYERTWTDEQDKQLKKLVVKYDYDWALIGTKINHSARQCRERWCYVLDPNLKKTAWTEQEDRILYEKHLIYGNRWVEIVKFLPGRTNESVKLRWYKATRRRRGKKAMLACLDVNYLSGLIKSGGKTDALNMANNADIIEVQNDEEQQSKDSLELYNFLSTTPNNDMYDAEELELTFDVLLENMDFESIEEPPPPPRTPTPIKKALAALMIPNQINMQISPNNLWTDITELISEEENMKSTKNIEDDVMPHFDVSLKAKQTRDKPFNNLNLNIETDFEMIALASEMQYSPPCYEFNKDQIDNAEKENLACVGLQDHLNYCKRMKCLK